MSADEEVVTPLAVVDALRDSKKVNMLREIVNKNLPLASSLSITGNGYTDAVGTLSNPGEY